MEGYEDAAEAGAEGGVEDGLKGRETFADNADAESHLRPEHVADIRPDCIDIVDVCYGPAADDEGGAGTGFLGNFVIWR